MDNNLDSEPATRGLSIADKLRRMIQSGEIPPGTRLRQVELAKRFGTSITPVREAFPILIRLGLIRQDSHRSPVVVQPTLLDLRDNIEIRLALEPLAARRATDRITAAQLAELEAIVSSATAVKDYSTHFTLDREFHALLTAAAGNTQLSEIVMSLRDAAYVYLQFEGPHMTPRQLEQVRLEHVEILTALKNHDAAAVERLVKAHLSAVLARAFDR